jgi:hypothetical protein
MICTHRISSGCRISPFLVASPPVRDLLLFAKHLLIAARDARSRGPSADAITAALAPTGRAPAVFGNGLQCLVGARYAVAAARHPARGAPLAGLSRLR